MTTIRVFLVDDHGTLVDAALAGAHGYTLKRNRGNEIVQATSAIAGARSCPTRRS